MNPLPILSQPLKLRSGATLSNRLVKAAMSEQLASPNRAPNENHVRLYERWGRSGAAALLTGNVMVDPRQIAEPGNVAVEDRRDLEVLRRWAQVSKAHGAQVWMQVNHPGRQAPKNLSRETVAPSAVGIELAGQFGTPRALTDAEIREIIVRFATTSAIAREAGFDGVQVHAAHGYLINQFLSPRSNLRDDAWGGDPERRRRFLLETVRAVRSAVGEDFVVSVKLNSADFQRGGFSEEESMDVVRALDAERIDLLEISGGTYESMAFVAAEERAAQSERTRQREAYFLDYAEKVRALTRAPLMVTGGFRTAAGMAKAITESGIEVIGLARPMALEPELPARLLSGAAAGSAVTRKRIGLKMLDGLAETSWYQQQLQRMGTGLDPDPKRGALTAVAVAMFRMMTGRRPRRVLEAAKTPADVVEVEKPRSAA